MNAPGQVIHLVQLILIVDHVRHGYQRPPLQGSICRTRAREEPAQLEVWLAVLKNLGAALSDPDHLVMRL